MNRASFAVALSLAVAIAMALPVFEEGEAVYLGQAAHCSGTGGQTETNGCTSGSLPTGTPVEVTGADKPGVLAYNSWLTMQADGESDPAPSAASARPSTPTATRSCAAASPS